MDDYKQITVSTYNTIADDYINRDQFEIKETEEVQSSLGVFASLLPPNAKVLDIGIGGGRDARRFAKHGFTVVGIDIAEDLLEKAARLENSGRISYLKMDMEDLEFPESSFDGVWANASLHHMPQQKLPAVLSKIHNFLKPDGYLQIKMHQGNTEGLVEEVKFGKNIRRFFSKYEIPEMRELLVANGFQVEEAHYATEGKWLDIRAKKI